MLLGLLCSTAAHMFRSDTSSLSADVRGNSTSLWPSKMLTTKGCVSPELVIKSRLVHYQGSGDVLAGSDEEFVPERTAPRRYLICDNFFGKVREQYGVAPLDELLSFAAYEPICSRGCSGGEGKSGAKYKFIGKANEGRFILKQMKEEEVELVMRKDMKLLKRYLDHVTANPNSLLTRMFAAIVEVDQYGNPDVAWLLINNWFPLAMPTTTPPVKMMYDLKGSTYGRIRTSGKTYKDLDWLNQKQRIKLRADVLADIVAEVSKDAAFLGKNKLIDYSLLVQHSSFNVQPCKVGSAKCTCDAFPVVHYTKQCFAADPNLFGALVYRTAHSYFCHESAVPRYGHGCVTGVENVKGSHVKVVHLYCFGIIDMLTRYTTTKVMENIGKSIIQTNPSVAHYSEYAKRFVEFLDTKVWESSGEQLVYSAKESGSARGSAATCALSDGFNMAHNATLVNGYLADAQGRPTKVSRNSSKMALTGLSVIAGL